MITTKCEQCKKEIQRNKSTLNRTKHSFCSKSCHRTYKNLTNNPSKNRDISGDKNPMFGKPNPKLKEWNDRHKGEKSPNWKGGIHTRKDGYVRINVEGKRHLLHRYLLKDKLSDINVVHHQDENPTNNDPKNLIIVENQAEHARKHKQKQHNAKSGAKSNSR